MGALHFIPTSAAVPKAGDGCHLPLCCILSLCFGQDVVERGIIIYGNSNSEILDISKFLPNKGFLIIMLVRLGVLATVDSEQAD